MKKILTTIYPLIRKAPVMLILKPSKAMDGFCRAAWMRIACFKISITGAFRISIILCTLLFSITTFAVIPDEQQQNAALVTSLLSQPLEKKEACAKLGYIGYQNSLSASYLAGTQGPNTKDPVKSYAWSVLAYHQLLATHNQAIIQGQQNTLNYIEKELQLTATQKEAAIKLANEIITQYGKSWPTAAEQMQYKDFPKPCSLISTEQPEK